MKFRALLTAALLTMPYAMASAQTAYPPPSTEKTLGAFRLKCTFSHRAQVDPIVAPGAASAHIHDFFGNRSTNANSTYDSMIVAGTTCAIPQDTAGYWAPSFLSPAGTYITAVTAFAYYRNRPVTYGTTNPFPPNFRMIAGGDAAFPNAFWNCFGDDSNTVRYASPPYCANDYLVGHVQFPNCWDGVHTDSPDHRSHMAYPVNNKCPQTHPVKLPNILFFERFPKNIGGTGYRLSDGQNLPHADFWNTWNQTKHESLVHDCLQAGVDCGFLKP